MIYAVFILNFVFASSHTQTKVLENNLVHVSIQRVERPEAEPVSKPYEVALTVFCKNKKMTKKINFPVCDFDPMDKENKISHTDISIAHHTWDAVKSSNNPDGKNYCDSKNKLFFVTKISDICK